MVKSLQLGGLTELFRPYPGYLQIRGHRVGDPVPCGAWCSDASAEGM